MKELVSTKIIACTTLSVIITYVLITGTSRVSGDDTMASAKANEADSSDDDSYDNKYNDQRSIADDAEVRENAVIRRFPWEPAKDYLDRNAMCRTVPSFIDRTCIRADDEDNFLSGMTFAGATTLRKPSCPCCQ
eukprot:CAMPEP_0172516950 /NCGR_PEP_ID=MMETSP1066-20121228/280320_1 /TAXON_ID=671091 /ORGANISM="Coscinodiscus wailesii, Strain CCMP2513" /LENGTH=133 /DNA_ID=CAMNT_0013298659 /DNA_START=106 /DNA_END=507 /DNA_ORIENTATION=+